MAEQKVIKLRPDQSSLARNDDKMIVQLNVGELRELIAEAIREATNRNVEADGLMDVEEAAKFIHQSETYVYRNWREMGGRKLGKNLRFTKADLQKWIDSKGC